MDFLSKTVVVTGTASGIGAETARLLKAAGAKVIGLDRNVTTENVDQFIQIDLSDSASIDAAVAQIPQGIDALCNVAGVPPTPGPEMVIKVNFIGLRQLTEALIEKMNDNASIINVSSVAGVMWSQNIANVKLGLALASNDDVKAFIEAHNIVSDGKESNAAYPFSKQMVNAWSVQNASRWADRGIRINVVSPGPVATPIIDDFVKSFGAKADEDIEAAGGAGKAEDIAPTIVYMAHESSSWVSGQNVATDGGLQAQIMRKMLGL